MYTLDFSAFLLVGLAFFSGVQHCLSQNEEKSFISWDDFQVDDQRVRLPSGSDSCPERVIVVDKSGGGDSTTIQGAIDIVPVKNTRRVKIYIRPGIYREKVIIPQTKPYISLIGNESHIYNTIITWSDKASDLTSTGEKLGTYNSASFTVLSDYFCATGITFENTVVAAAGDKDNQAVALRLAGTKAMLYKVSVLGTQDTLLDDIGLHYFYKCYIQGTVDFICGSGKSLYKDCTFHSVAKDHGAISANRRESPDDTGFSFVNCVINGTGIVFLGRAWGNHSRTIYSDCYMEDIIHPARWSNWNDPTREKTVEFGEYGSKGPGAVSRRDSVPWAKNFSLEEVGPYLDLKFVNGDQWLRL